MRTVAVVVHYGPVAPTIEIARAVLPLVGELVVAVNDGSVRPAGLPDAAHWIDMDRNLGYAAAFTRAVHGREADLFVLLNNDIEMSPEAFRVCVQTFEADPAIGVLGPVLRYPDGRLQSGAGRLTRWSRSPRSRIEPSQGVTDCEWVTGAAMFMRGDLVSTVGMDGSYFLGYEDTDFCVRARRAGYRVVCHGGSLDDPSRFPGDQRPAVELLRPAEPGLVRTGVLRVPSCCAHLGRSGGAHPSCPTGRRG
jgi:N-acetylglucosaminyl-diphospho-decaprenol L-rhamnosyltransferase